MCHLGGLQYLHEQGCEIEGTKDQRGQVIDWLLQQAVGFEYKDNGMLVTPACCVEHHLHVSIFNIFEHLLRLM